MPDIIAPTTPKRHRPWTPEEAREMAVRANRIRWHSDPRPPLNSVKPREPEPQVPQDNYHIGRLNRVRIQLDQLDSAITRETGKQQPDGQRLNWLASAQERLAEQERILAGRPLPGSRRPAQERASRQQTSGVLSPVPIPEPNPPMTQDQAHTPPMTPPTDQPTAQAWGAPGDGVGVG